MLTSIFPALVRNTVFLEELSKLQCTDRKGTAQEGLFLYLFPLLSFKIHYNDVAMTQASISCAPGKAD